MYKRAHHNAIAKLLAAFNSDLLQDAECYFGGGTAIVLLLDEYRESVDVDFRCASAQGYRRLRELTFKGQFSPLLNPGARIDMLCELRADQYGIRTVLDVDGIKIKFEIIREGRVDLSGAMTGQLDVPVLAREDLYCEKLLANADRYADRAVRSRDIIDLGLMMSRWGAIPESAWTKARAAYGSAIDAAYDAAVAGIRNPEWLRMCMQDMAMDLSLTDEIMDTFGGPVVQA
ncbi:hypothetical protein AWH62_08495 [Maricaulis sp. W15]|uniref:nucleotidyl transferase AbiEii/AbiGii toxin family protein n=1 Tax=Maricaulis sp. W15 TaxID=1772333 RepID=UPI000948E915|nr:nucleotidyl transferase AbiEii/AbiGii toxin family protein [Maricaulis sp. W15]OLF72986.1 hypothetical protein AWH62_08495 [Maricaulis sp. W15]